MSINPVTANNQHYFPRNKLAASQFQLCFTFFGGRRCGELDALEGDALALLVFVALAGEPHLAVDPLVLQHIHDVIKQLPTVAADQDVRVTCQDEKCFNSPNVEM